MKKYMKNIKNRFMFTNKTIRELTYGGTGMADVYYDAGCPHLAVYVFPSRSSYYLTIKGRLLLVGNVYEITVEDARAIVRNIMDNEAEFKRTKLTPKVGLHRDFKQNGFFPRNKEFKGTEVVLSNENGSLKQKIAELIEENNKLFDENKKYRDKIGNILVGIKLIREATETMIDALMEGEEDETKD